MATAVPPPSKRQRRENLERTRVQQDITAILPPENGSFKARFIDGDGQQLTDIVEVPLADASERNVSLLLNTLLGRESDDFLPYRFRITIPGTDPPLIIDQFPSDLHALLQQHGIENAFETTITLSAEPQAVFKVQSVTRLAQRIPGHGEAILCASFSPATSKWLATGSGDDSARIWDTEMGTPKHTLKGHTGWCLGVAWSPDGERLASCSMDTTVRLWDPNSGKSISTLRGHSKWVLAMAWEPYHLWRESPRLASASKDTTIRIWIANTGRTEHVLWGHKGSISSVKWGGTGLIFSGSHDKTIRVWNAKKGTLVHELKAHAHWVNHLALSSEAVLRTGYFDHTKDIPDSDEAKKEKALERFQKAASAGGKVRERIASASDDYQIYLWDPVNEGTKPIAKLGGHQNKVNHLAFSPDGTLLASAGWDNHVKLWSAKDGKFINTLRGHVAPVYQCCFSADSRLLVSASKDSTVKVWSMRTCKLASDLPGHSADVFAVDWSPGGQSTVASAGQDKAVRIWKN